MKTILHLSLVVSLLLLPARAEEDTAESSPEGPPTFVVVLPEQVDDIWYWIIYTTSAQHIVQSAVERALINAGHDVVAASLLDARVPTRPVESLLELPNAIELAREIGVDYLIAGQATAVVASRGSAYGVNVVRSQADITARLIRVADGRILEVFTAEALEGDQAPRIAGQKALKQAARTLTRSLVRACTDLTPPPEPGFQTLETETP